jgi:hypothetical protein
MTLQLTKVDELVRGDHSYLEDDDVCYFLREYTAYVGYTHSATNDLISNLKKPVSRRGRPEYRWKQWAIDTAGDELKAAINPKWLAGAVLVPMPPSKTSTDPEYDDRMVQVAARIANGAGADVRELLVRNQSMPAQHQSSAPRSISALLSCLEINEALREPPPSHIGVLDDMLTTGAHFRAARTLLAKHFPSSQIIGVFIARRAVAREIDVDGLSAGEMP